VVNKGGVFIYEITNQIVSALLNVKISDIEDINVTSDTVFIKLAKKECLCSKCNRKMIAHGTYSRVIKTPNKAFEGLTIVLKTRRYVCRKCGITTSDLSHLVPVNKKLSYSSIIEIMELLKSPKMTFKEVSNITGVPLTSVIRTFDNHCHIPRKEFPIALCIDEVYTKNSDYKSKYSCIFYDFLNRSLIDVLPCRRKNYLHYYMKYISEIERNRVNYICIDMYETYRYIAYKYFKKAIICVDSFHVVKHLNDDLKDVRVRITKRYNTSSQEYYLLKNFDFLLFDRSINLYGEKRFNKRFKQYLNYGDLLNMILAIDDDLAIAYGLKEEYSDFNATCDVNKARELYDDILDDFIKADIPEFQEFIVLLKNWRTEIINSFTIIKGQRINNGIAESLNQDIAALIYNTKGIRKSERRRKRIMYAINKDGFNLK